MDGNIKNLIYLEFKFVYHSETSQARWLNFQIWNSDVPIFHGDDISKYKAEKNLKNLKMPTL